MKLYLDANVIIYGHEAAEAAKQLVLQRMLDWCRQPDGEFVTSIFSRLECRVLPLRNGDLGLLAEYDQFFGCGAVEIAGVSEQIIDLATTLRAQYGFKSPDAIHLATAIEVGAQRFYTSDAALQKCVQINVEVFVPPSAVPPSPT